MANLGSLPFIGLSRNPPALQAGGFSNLISFRGESLSADAILEWTKGRRNRYCNITIFIDYNITYLYFNTLS